MGHGGVGKTSLVNRYVHQRFLQNYMQTLGQDVFSKKITIDNNQVITQIYDIAGQERFESFRPAYLRGSDLGLAVFDLTIPKTITELKNAWLPELSKTLEKPFYLSVVGNKSDLKDQRAVDEAHGKELVSYIKKKFTNINIVEYIETSAKENEDVDMAFLNLVQKFVSDKKTKTSSRRH
jgi:Ras-related protein Rab-7A